MNTIVKPITADGRTGFDQFGQLMAWSKPSDGVQSGHMIRDVRTSICYICGKGWGNTTEELVDQTSDQAGHVMHRSCYDGVQKLNSYYDIQTALINGGFLFRMEEVEPRYPYSTPWQRVTVLFKEERADSGFRIVLGRRKRVWELRLHGVGDLSEQFKDELFQNNTMGYQESSREDIEFGPYFYIHAWSKKEMVDFLKVFHQAISKVSGQSIERD